jgi:uncharacterized membrane protein YbhN (UPF0104 family)
MNVDFTLRALISRRVLLATALFAAAAAVVAAMPRLLGARVGDAIAGLEDARPGWLWLAALGFLGSLLAASSGWRSALALCGGRLSRSDAAARYGIGSLVNSLSPARVGEPVRIALFARALEGGDRGWRMGGVFGVIAAVRCVVFGVVVVVAAALGAVPFRPVLVLGGVSVAAGVVAFVARDRTPRTHVAHLLDAFRELARSPLGGARVAGWIALSAASRFCAAVAIAAALGVPSPVSAALVIMPALYLAGLIPLSGNLGITSGAVVLALHTRGVPLGQAATTGLAFQAVETAAGVTFGLAGAMLLARFSSPLARRRLLVIAGAGATACVAAGVCATVVLPVA